MASASREQRAGNADDGWEITGNHYLTFSRIARSSGAVHSINVLHRGLLGLAEWSAERAPTPAGEPLLEPFCEIDGARVVLPPLRWERLDRWIPTFRCELADGLSLTCTLCAPGGFDPLVRGGLIQLELHCHSGGERAVTVGLDGCWRWTQRCVRSSRPLAGEPALVRGADPGGLALEAAGRVALAIVASGRASYLLGEDGAPLAEVDAGRELRTRPGEALRFRVARTLTVRPGRRSSAQFFLGVAPERDGALATAAYLAGRGASDLLRLARLDLARIVRAGRETPVLAMLNRNLVFSHYCAVARALDDDRIYPIASRIPMHGETAVFDEIQALLWTVPAITRVDPYLGREVLIRTFEGFSDRPGLRQRYVDGGILAPGFSLGRLCAYGIAVDRFAQDTNDATVIDEPLVQDVLRELDENLWSRLHPQVFLGATEVLASGEPADYPYVAWDNVLLWRFCRALGQIWRGDASEPPARLNQAEDEIEAAFWQRCTAEIEGLPVIAYASDLEGQVAIYDDPAGSLRMLPFLGFCAEDDPIWSNTMDLLRSKAYPLYHGDRPFPGGAGRSAPDVPGLATLCADLLTPRRDAALALLRKLRLDGGVACTGYDPETGATAAGPYDAALAGFLAWALDQGREPAPRPKGRRK